MFPEEKAWRGFGRIYREGTGICTGQPVCIPVCALGSHGYSYIWEPSCFAAHAPHGELWRKNIPPVRFMAGLPAPEKANKLFMAI